jgi:hypothetical protein
VVYRHAVGEKFAVVAEGLASSFAAAVDTVAVVAGEPEDTVVGDSAAAALRSAPEGTAFVVAVCLVLLLELGGIVLVVVGVPMLLGNNLSSPEGEELDTLQRRLFVSSTRGLDPVLEKA